MYRIFYCFSLFLIISSCEQKIQAVKQDKIGFVDNSKVINGYQEKKDLESKYEVLEKAFTKKFDSLDRAFQIEAQKFQSSAQKMAPAVAQQKYQELAQKKQYIDQQQQTEAQEFRNGYQKEVDSLVSKIKKFEKNYGKSNGYKFILGTSDVTSSVLYGEESMDLTKTILESLNKEYKEKK